MLTISAPTEKGRKVLIMAEYIVCRRCDSPDCKGCNLKRLETMLENGKFDCLMNENRSINTSADVAPVIHGRWVHTDLALHWHGKDECSECTYHKQDRSDLSRFRYCPNCGARMDEVNE